MTDVIVVPPPGARGDAEARIDPAGADIAVCEWSDAGPWPGPPLHVHHSGDEAWHVLEGTLRFRLAGREFDAPAGTTVYAPRGVPHTFGNPGPGPSRYLIILSPHILHLIDEIHTIDHTDAEAMAAVWRKYDSEIIAP